LNSSIQDFFMDFRRTISTRITTPLVPFLNKLGLTPDIVTWTGLVITVAAATVVAMGHLIAGGILLLVAGLFDILDGALARFAGKTTTFGAILDSTFDRLSESLMLFGLAVFSVRQGDTINLYLIFAVLVGSFLVSYVRARAEGMGIECRVGLFTRAERVIILALGLLVNQVFIALIVLAVFCFFTFGQRMVHVYRKTKKK
jgi:CDP-diacylglycerol--glycerol-3-phosphate 3-phosphatidyltransferase